MKKKYLLKTAAAIAAAFFCVTGIEAQTMSPYAGEESREIKTLSPDDIDQLENGRGWGLAKAAELNGYPGPIHVLEMKDQLGLTPEQEARIRLVYEQMKEPAIPAGRELIELESRLNTVFSEGKAEAQSLSELLQKIGETAARLRFIHLSAHLKMPVILTKEQAAKYNELRGYGSDPCKNIPEGHDPAMWKKHNGCQ